jgi:rhomboid protease GluP
MPHCLACGRELAGEGELCPECQTQGKNLLRLPDPRMTKWLIGVSVLLFACMAATAGSPFRRTYDVLPWGADNGVLVLLYKQYWRLFMANFVHINLAHLALNMFCLWGLGRWMEFFYSRRDYLLMYLYTGIASSVLSVFLHPYVTSAGASGAVFGLSGALLTTLKYGRVPISDGIRKILFRQVLEFAGLNLVVGIGLTAMSFGVNNAGHIGGLFSGLLAGAIVGPYVTEDARKERRRRWVFLWCLLGVFLYLVVRLRVG